MTTKNTIENQKITLGKAAVVFIFISQAIITYMASNYGTASAIEKLDHKFELKIQKLESKHEVYDDKFTEIKSVLSYRNAIKPESPKLTNYTH